MLSKQIRVMRLFIAKISLDMTIWCYRLNEARALLEEVLITEVGKKVVLKDGTEWAFAEVAKRDDGIISGKFGKRISKKKVDLSGIQFVKVEDYDWQYCNFVVTADKKYVIFESRDHISVAQFKKRFPQVCSHFNVQLGCLMVEPLRDESQIFDILGRADSIYEFSYNIRIPNPSGEDRIWGPVLNELNETGADTISQKFISRDGKINHLSAKIKAAIKMSAHGLGNFKALILKDGRKRSVSSDNSNITIKVESSDDPLEYADTFIESFRDILSKSEGGVGN